VIVGYRGPKLERRVEKMEAALRRATSLSCALSQRLHRPHPLREVTREVAAEPVKPVRADENVPKSLSVPDETRRAQTR